MSPSRRVPKRLPPEWMSSLLPRPQQQALRLRQANRTQQQPLRLPTPATMPQPTLRMRRSMIRTPAITELTARSPTAMAATSSIQACLPPLAHSLVSADDDPFPRSSLRDQLQAPCLIALLPSGPTWSASWFAVRCTDG